MSFIFGGNTGETAESVKRKREIARALLGNSFGSVPKNLGEGLSQFGSVLAYRKMMADAKDAEATGQASGKSAMADIVGALTGYSDYPAAPGASSSSIPAPGAAGEIAASAPGASGGALPSSFMSAVDRTEGAGKYDTLYGHAQSGGPFAGTDVSKMTVQEALAFSDPSGPYAQYVKSKVGRVATPMGRHQIVGTTLRNAVKEMGIDPNAPFDAQTQDAIAAHLARNRISGASTMSGKIAALREEWHGLRNVPDAQLEQIVRDLEGPGAAPAQVASLDPSAGMSPAAAAIEAQAPRSGYVDPDVKVVPPAAAPTDGGFDTRRFGADAPVAQGQTGLAAELDRTNAAGAPKQQIASALLAPTTEPPADPKKAAVDALMADALVPKPRSANDEAIMRALITASGNNWLNDNQRQIVNALLGEQIKNSDPSRALDMEYKRAQIEKLQRESAAGGQPDLGLNPQYGVDANGNPVLLQLGKNGKVVQSQMPEGVALSKEPIKLDAGTHFVLLDPITRQPVGQVPKDLAGAEAEKAGGKAQGEARAALPQVEAAANELLSSIDSLANDQYLGNMLGPWDSRTPNLTADAARVQSKMDQIGGQAFMQAFQMLRGAGQITEQEGAKATAAMARLNAAQSEADYRAALNELRGVVQRAVETARRKAGAGDAAGQTQPGGRLRFNPQTGELE